MSENTDAVVRELQWEVKQLRLENEAHMPEMAARMMTVANLTAELGAAKEKIWAIEAELRATKKELRQARDVIAAHGNSDGSGVASMETSSSSLSSSPSPPPVA